MKKLVLIFTLAFLAVGCSTPQSVGEDQRTIKKRVVAVEKDGSSTIISTGRLDAWYRVDTRLTEGMMYDVTLEVPRVVTEPLIVPATIIDLNPLDFLQRDVFGRFINKYHEIKSAQKEEPEEASSDEK